MSIKVTNFKWEKGKNDLTYIALLEMNLDAMMDRFRECSKVAREQYNKGYKNGRADCLKEAHGFVDQESYKEGFKRGIEQGKADAIEDAIHRLDNSKAICHEDYVDGIDFAIGVLRNIVEWKKGAEDEMD